MRFLFLLFYYETIWAQGLNQPKIQVDNGHLKFTGIFKKLFIISRKLENFDQFFKLSKLKMEKIYTL